ncbi:hypothetical protein DPMN_169008 [Dreissena polymorpha]|uniref:Uncharacterized protein n=1 Tax=Dreissena polymorpha TaxID=45954 RepID=A0A9D4F3S1_DREPO|nr:hypothetical protein DPMN_169008 [Dreissena polymorpha]
MVTCRVLVVIECCHGDCVYFRNNSTHRGWIKKIRFAPGRGNYKFLLLYNEGADVWDINEGKVRRNLQDSLDLFSGYFFLLSFY